MSILITTCALLVAAVDPASPAGQRFFEAQAIFDAARQALAQPGGDVVAARKQFYEAATRFATLAREGVRSAQLYVNTGNAFHFAGSDARALLWYLRANRLSNTVQTREGLATLRHACGAEPWLHEYGSIGRALMFWHYDLSQPIKQWILLAAYPLGCLMVIVALVARRRSRWLRLGFGMMLIGATMGISDLVASSTAQVQWAVVLETGKGHAGDGESYSIILDHLTPGQEVQIIESRPHWIHIALPSGTRCWVPAEICEQV